MFFDVYCMACGEWILRCDSKKLAFPFTSDMFEVPIETAYGRMWRMPPRIDGDLQCPECLSFPFGWRSGGPEALLRVKIDEDKRFSRSANLEEIKEWTDKLEYDADMERRIAHAEKHHTVFVGTKQEKIDPDRPSRAYAMTPEKKAKIDRLMDDLKAQGGTAATRKNARERARSAQRKGK